MTSRSLVSFSYAPMELRFKFIRIFTIQWCSFIIKYVLYLKVLRRPLGKYIQMLNYISLKSVLNYCGWAGGYHLV